MVKRMALMCAALWCAADLAAAAAGKNEAPTPANTPNKPDYCRECHKKLDGRPRAAALEWETSVHGKGACNACHGGNPDLNDAKAAKAVTFGFIGRPDRRAIVQFCGRGECHASVIGIFKKGLHFAAVEQKGDPGCASCHGSHGVKRPAMSIIPEKLCMGCHPADYYKGILHTLGTAEDDVSAIARRVAGIAARGVDTGDSLARIQRARDYLQRCVHLFSKEELQSKMSLIKFELTSVKDNQLDKAETMRRLDLLYFLIVAFSIGFILVGAVYIVRIYTAKKG